VSIPLGNSRITTINVMIPMQRDNVLRVAPCESRTRESTGAMIPIQKEFVKKIILRLGFISILHIIFNIYSLSHNYGEMQ